MVIKLFRRYTLVVSILILAVVIVVTMLINVNIHSRNSSSSILESEEPNRSSEISSQTESLVSTLKTTDINSNEIRAVWVPFLSLDMSKESDKSEKAFQQKFNAIVSGAKNAGINTLIVHVRPFGDALYPSSFYPWSHLLTGTQGVNPGYDPLKYMVEATHKAGLKIHAWINPLRIQINSNPTIIASNNPYTVWKSDKAKANWTVDYKSGKYFNPAYPQVRKLIADGAKEIAQKYDVDGIQFDDYFYPTSEADFDKIAYDAYQSSASKTGTPLGLADWRRANINALVSLVYTQIKAVKPNVQFGIAPQGNVQNDWNMGADVNSWCSTSGYVDYICPQLYVNFENPTLPFEETAVQWRKMVTNPNIKLYLGLAAYKAGSDVDSGTWKKSNSILAQQVQVCRKNNCDGFMFYSWAYLDNAQTKEEIQNVMKVLN